MRTSERASLCALLLLAACGGDAREQTAAPPDSVAIALAQFEPARFDTITWTSDTARTNRGAVVWNFSCKKCHGQIGRGDGGMVVEGDTIRPPDFTTSWRFGTDEEAVIRYIFAGNAERMPHWGIQGLAERDIHAVTGYILKHLVGISDWTVQTPRS